VSVDETPSDFVDGPIQEKGNMFERTSSFTRRVILSATFALLLVASTHPASASDYRTHVDRIPATPESSQTVRIWMDSNTVNGETAFINTKVGDTFTLIEGHYDDTSHAGANWYADIPAYRDGTYVQYELVTRNENGSFYGWTGLNWNYTVTTSASVAAAAAVYSAPTAYNGNVYFGSDDGKLYGYSIAGKTALPGFPFDARAEGAGAAAKIKGRPAFRFVNGSAYLFFLTDNGYIGRVGLNGDGSLNTAAGVAKLYRPDATVSDASTTPAAFSVGADDYIFAAMTTATGAKLFKVPEDTMATADFADFGPGTSVTSSPAGGAGTNIYVGITGSTSGIVRVNASNLTQLASAADGENVGGSPFISGTTGFFNDTPVMYVGADSGTMYAVNAVNGTPLSGFGTAGATTVHAGVPLTSAYLFNNNLYTTGATDGEVWKVDAKTGTVTQFYNVQGEGNGKVRAGLAVDPKDNGYLVWGTDTGRFYQVDVSNANNKRIHTLATDTPFTTVPAIDPVSGKVVAGNIDGNVYIYAR
jgi:hypothetical protein